MATLIQNINWSDFVKVQKAGKMEELASGEVFFNGKYLFTFINGNTEETGFVRTQAEYLGLKGNTVGGKLIEDIDVVEVEVQEKPVVKLVVKPRAKKRRKREVAHANV